MTISILQPLIFAIFLHYVYSVFYPFIFKNSNKLAEKLFVKIVNKLELLNILIISLESAFYLGLFSIYSAYLIEIFTYFITWYPSIINLLYVLNILSYVFAIFLIFFFYASIDLTWFIYRNNITLKSNNSLNFKQLYKLKRKSVIIKLITLILNLFMFVLSLILIFLYLKQFELIYPVYYSFIMLPNLILLPLEIIILCLTIYFGVKKVLKIRNWKIEDKNRKHNELEKN
ncbi:MAG: hypothetical protein ACTSPQ_14655 [Candidatus Helarchaeota archaeon]